MLFEQDFLQPIHQGFHTQVPPITTFNRCNLRNCEKSGKKFSIVVVAEGALPGSGTFTHRGPREPGQELRLGGIGEQVPAAIEKATGKETRVVVLGHLQRGGQPTTFDRVLGTRFGSEAVRLIRQGRFGHMVALAPPNIESVPIRDAIATMKTVPLDSDILLSARDIGISFGD